MPRTILTLVFFLGAIAVAVFYVWPQFGVYRAVRSDTKVLEHVGAALDSAQATLDVLDEKMRSLSKADLERIEAALPKGFSRDDMIRTVEQYGFEYHVLVKSIQMADTGGEETRASGSETTPRPGGSALPGDSKNQKEVSVTLQIAGPYHDMRNFLNALEKNIRIIDVTSISFGGFDSPSQSLSVSLKAKTYYQ